VHLRPIVPARGVIYDRNKAVLAKNTPVFNLTLSRELAGDTDAVVDNLARILDLTPAEKSRIEKDLRHARRAFEPVTLMLDLSEKQ
ncbi:penicillin-binding protein 2, partial [Klebsiella quasipneumoniae]|nr:penicillin-binding protein 2 [Klebsiella quasipneumoniae]